MLVAKSKSEDKLTWKDIEVGAISTEPGSACEYKTGDWRSRRPTYDFSKCIKCAICQTFCPEGAIKPNKEGYYEADLYHCKGCGICSKECPTKVITMVEEKE
jgi:pyruvate ferredoxin oxidoreductase delta subunit